MIRTRVKICGLKDLETAIHACEIGTDAVGLVFYPPSPRNVEPDLATSIARQLPPFVTRVGLFMDPEPEWVESVLSRVALDCLQFHGTETPEYCRQFGRTYLKAVPMADEPDLEDYARRYADAAGLLLDSNATGEAGGSGRRFDWGRMDAGCSLPLILAGGLNPDNVADAVAAVSPYAVDVSSGVESRRGVKDYSRMRAFVDEVRRADACRTSGSLL